MPEDAWPRLQRQGAVLLTAQQLEAIKKEVFDLQGRRRLWWLTGAEPQVGRGQSLTPWPRSRA